MKWGRGAAESQVSRGIGSRLDNNPIHQNNLDNVENRYSDDNFILCPVCRKKIYKNNIYDICKYCGFDVSFTENDRYSLLKHFENNGWIIDNKKNLQYIDYKFYMPYTAKDIHFALKKYSDFIKSNSVNNSILFVSNKKNNLDFMKSLLKNKENKILDLSEVLTSPEDLKKFKKINDYLNKEYSIMLFEDFEDMQFIADLNVVPNDCLYIDDNDANELNDFIKIYWDYTNHILSDENFNEKKISIDAKIREFSKKLINFKKSIIWFDSSLKELDSLYNLLHINCSNVYEKICVMDNLFILNNNPNLININNSKKFIDLLSEYQENNVEKTIVINKLNYFKEKLIIFIDFIKIYFNNYIFRKLNSKISNFSKYDFITSFLNQLQPENNILNSSDYNVLEYIEKFNTDLDEIKKSLKNKYVDVDKAINDMNFVINNLSALNDEYFILFDGVEDNFNKSSIKLFGDVLNQYSYLYKLECKINDYRNIISINLNGIWKGLFSDIDAIKNKLEMDEKYTLLYNKGIFAEDTIKSFHDLSDEKIKFIKSFNRNIENKKDVYCTIHENGDKLLSEINKLKHSDNIYENYSIFKEINAILNLEELNGLIKLIGDEIINYNKHTDYYVNELNQYKEISFKYFNKTNFDYSFNELNQLIAPHIKFTQLIDNKIIHEDKIQFIKNNNDDFLTNVNQLDELSSRIYKNSLDTSPLDKDLKDNFPIIISSLESAINIFNQDYVSYFDYVILDDNKNISNENRLQLFLISKNKLKSTWFDK